MFRCKILYTRVGLTCFWRLSKQSLVPLYFVNGKLKLLKITTMNCIEQQEIINEVEDDY